MELFIIRMLLPISFEVYFKDLIIIRMYSKDLISGTVSPGETPGALFFLA
jgi:membrane protein CcdC involved in cytochrome C biogenesis